MSISETDAPELPSGPGLVLGVYRRHKATTIAGVVAPLAERDWQVALWALDEVVHDLGPWTLGCGPGARLPLLQEAYTRAAPTSGWVVISDDDVVFVEGDSARFVALAARAGLDIAQPAHAPGSLVNHPITVRVSGTTARRTTFVECGPLVAVSPTWRSAVFPLPSWRGMGWGHELEWSDLAKRGCSLGIVDATAIRHLKPAAGSYDPTLMQRRVRAELAQRGVRRWHEHHETLQAWSASSPDPPPIPSAAARSPAAATVTAMRVVVTVLAGRDAELLAANVAFHLAVGADHVLVSKPADGAGDPVLAGLVGAGLVTCRPSRYPLDPAAERLELEREAVEQHGADWLVHAEESEFWWPRAASLRNVLAEIPPEYGIVHGLWRPFVPRPGGGAFFERRCLRFAAYAAILGPDAEYRPASRPVHRAHPAGPVSARAASYLDEPFVPVRGWYPFEILHFPPGGPLAAGTSGGSLDELLWAFADEEQVASGEQRGVLVEDTRLRDALRELAGRPHGTRPELTLAPPTFAEGVAHAADVSALLAADETVLRRDLDRVALRVASLEALAGVRAERGLRRLIRRG